MAATKLNVGLILGSTRDGRMCDRVKKFVLRAVEKEHSVIVVDPLDKTLPKTQQSMNWLMNPSAVPDDIKELNEEIAKCDALIVIHPEYNWSVPPALAEIVDNISVQTCIWTPCAVVGYSIGSSGGWRGGMQVRQLMGAVGCTVSQKQMGIACVHQSLDADGNPQNESLEPELTGLLNQLYWLSRAIKNHKGKENPPQFTI